VLLGGTSGSGKTTIGALLSDSFRFQCLLSTDAVRNVLRHYYSKEEHPVLFTSSYHAGVGSKDNVIEGFEAQNDLLVDKLDEFITRCESRQEDVLIEVSETLVAYSVFSDFEESGSSFVS
jgi:2-phosphoglycerate kinase